MAEPAQPKEEKALSIEKPLRYYGEEDVIPMFADVAATRHTEYHFSLLFFQAIVPITTTDDPKVAQAAVENLNEVPAKCIAKIVIPPSLMRDLYKVMGTNIERWEKLVALKQATEAQESEATAIPRKEVS